MRLYYILISHISTYCMYIYIYIIHHYVCIYVYITFICSRLSGPRRDPFCGSNLRPSDVLMSLRWAQPWLPWVVPTFGRKPCSFFNACQLVVGMWSVTVLPWQQQPLGSTGNWGSFGLWRWRSSTEVVLLPTLWSKIMSSILLPIIAMHFVGWVCCHVGRRVRIKQSVRTVLQHQNRMVFVQISNCDWMWGTYSLCPISSPTMQPSMLVRAYTGNMP